MRNGSILVRLSIAWRLPRLFRRRRQRPSRPCPRLQWYCSRLRRAQRPRSRQMQQSSSARRSPCSLALSADTYSTLSEEASDVDEASGDRCRRRHCRAHQVRTASCTLTTLEIAIRRRRAALAGLEAIVVHRKAHRAAGFAPFEAGVAKYAIQPLGFGLSLHGTGTRHDQRQLDAVSHAAAANDGGRLTKIFNPRIRARADEHFI